MKTNRDRAFKIRYIMCKRKTPLTQQIADEIVTEHLQYGKLTYYYRCPFCKAFHLTKKEPSLKRKERMKWEYKLYQELTR
jgi:transposase-like protein